MPRHNDAAEFPWARPAHAGSDVLERRTASRAPTVESDVNVPLLQSMASGAMGAAVIGGVAGWALWDAVALMIGAVAGYVLVAGAVWSMLLVDHRRLLWDNERAAHVGAAPEEPASERTLRVEMPWYNEHGRLVRMEYLNIRGVSEDQIKQFAGEVCRGMPMTVAAWTGKGAPFTRSQFDALMGYLIRGGLVRDNGTQGRELTRAGVHVLHRIAELPAPPYPVGVSDAETA